MLGTHYRGEVIRQIHKILMHTDIKGYVTDRMVSLADYSSDHPRGAARSVAPRSLREGVLHGGVGLGRAVTSGLTGLVTAPVRGAAEGGVSGFAKGLGRGLVGVAVKPTTGVIDFAAKAAEGLTHNARVGRALAAEGRGRMRLPRMLLGPAREIMEYDETMALGWRVLHRVANAEYAAEPCMGCVPSLDEGCLHILTDLRLMSVRVEGHVLLWLVALRDVQGVQLIDSTNSLLLTVASSQSTQSGGAVATSVRAVMCADAASSRFMQKQVVECISLV
mmetsp:Transcript_20488/g.49156  ORF Transcript_20488/g.49156 Transcript_20488/m.49156 type:complete len:277 (+) Transcript_20488:2-832(+)